MRAQPFRNDAFEAQLLGGSEHLGTVAGNGLAELHARFRRART
jgi:hypothetical protein